ncbi:MAG: glycosyltransferase family 4 protein [Burkholderiaceae bacterium]|nr:glycosyltransferase family 4 protein [Microbacteriaceae bacterium]
MRIVTATAMLRPAGGIEVGTYQGGAAMVQRGHEVEVLYGQDGPQRGDYEHSGMRLTGPFRFGFDPRRALRDLRGYWPAALFLRRIRADVLWLHRPEHIIWAQFVARWAGVPIACHVHHGPNYRLTRFLMTGVSSFIAVSEFTRQTWVAAGIRPERITVVHNAIPADAYPFGGEDDREDSRRVLGIPDDVPVVLYYGRITQEKGVTTLVDAWRLLGHGLGESTPGKLLLVGSPAPHDDPAIDAALALLDPSSYRWYPARADVIGFLHAADVVVVPSWWDEPFGRVVIEAMSTGRPVIGARVGGIPEILSGEMSRFLVDPRDAEALAANIRSTIGWRTREPSLGSACREWVDTHFSFEDYLDAIERWLLENSRGSHRPRRSRRD